MESYKSKCMDCERIYSWTGCKTGIGKSKEQLLEMAKQSHTCKYCNSKMLITDLNWDGSIYEPDKYRFDADMSILTEREIKRANEYYSDIDPTIYTCKHCYRNKFTVITRWEDSDGKFLLLFCMDCKKRFVLLI